MIIIDHIDDIDNFFMLDRDGLIQKWALIIANDKHEDNDDHAENDYHSGPKRELKN